MWVGLQVLKLQLSGRNKMSEKNNAALAKFEKQKHDAAVDKLPEFIALDLTDDPKQIVGLIRRIKEQANAELVRVADAITAIQNTEFYLIGRCFGHLKTITDQGKYKEAIEELGYTYDTVKIQVKTTETYIKQLLTRKKDIDVLLPPGMLGTIARNLNRDELTALGQGKEVLGLRDKDLEGKSQREAIALIKTARAERDNARQATVKLKDQRDKSNTKNRNLQDQNKQLETALDLATKGPKSVEEAHIVCSNIRACAASISVYIDQLKVMAHSDEVAAAGHETITFAKLKIQIKHDEFYGTETDPKVTKQLEALEKLFGIQQ